MSKKNLRHVWVGQFSPEAPEAYFVQEFVNDETPLSQFGAEQGTRKFDYDFVEISFANDPMPLREIIGMHSYSSSYIEAVIKKLTDLGVNEANVFVLARKDQFQSPKSVEGIGYKLWYLGEYPCRS